MKIFMRSKQLLSKPLDIKLIKSEIYRDVKLKSLYLPRSLSSMERNFPPFSEVLTNTNKIYLTWTCVSTIIFPKVAKMRKLLKEVISSSELPEPHPKAQKGRIQVQDHQTLVFRLLKIFSCN